MTPATQPSQHAVHSPHCLACAAGMGAIAITAPWHFLYFFPLPQGHGSLRPTDMETVCLGRGPVYSSDPHGTAFLAPEHRTLLVYLAVSMSLLQGVSMRGAKMLVSLSALEMHAT